jgi:amino acid transporter
MTNHQSPVSAAIILTAAAVVLVVVFIGFRLGRTSAAWRDVRNARRDVPVKRRLAWQHTRGATAGVLVLVVVLAAAVNDLIH